MSEIHPLLKLVEKVSKEIHILCEKEQTIRHAANACGLFIEELEYTLNKTSKRAHDSVSSTYFSNNIQYSKFKTLSPDLWRDWFIKYCIYKKYSQKIPEDLEQREEKIKEKLICKKNQNMFYNFIKNANSIQKLFPLRNKADHHWYFCPTLQEEIKSEFNELKAFCVSIIKQEHLNPLLEEAMTHNVRSEFFISNAITLGACFFDCLMFEEKTCLSNRERKKCIEQAYKDYDEKLLGENLSLDI